MRLPESTISRRQGRIMTKCESLASKLRSFLPTVYKRYGSLNARQYAYRAEAIGLVKKSQFDYLNRILTDLREEQVLPWSAVLDSSRKFEPYLVRGSENPEGIVDAYIQQFRGLPTKFDLPLWQYQPVIPVIFTEKEGLIPYFQSITDRQAISVYAQRGQVGKSHLHEVVFPWLMNLVNDGKRVRMLYLGDCDDEGFQIPVTLIETITKWAGRPVEYDDGDLFPKNPRRKMHAGASITFERLALLPSQVEKLNLPKDAINPKSMIGKKFVDYKCELEAMDPGILRALIENALSQSWHEDAERKRKSAVSKMRTVLKQRIDRLTETW